MKSKRTPEKKSLARQLLSGAIYTALASVVVAVTVNTTVRMISDRNSLFPDNTPQNIDVKIPSVPEIPPLKLPEIDVIPGADETPITVSDTAEGVSDTITGSESENVATTESLDFVFEIPDEADLGIDRFIKPCDGYVSKEHSADIPVYSATLSDYRVHVGIDITGDIGTPVSAICGGIITEIYDDDLLGKTVCVKTKSGYTVRYSNLLPELNARIKVNETIATGDIIGGIGETALSEAVDSSHLHLEIYDAEGNAENPEKLISF